jgi:AraC-like DNA-binding protein
MLVETVYRSDDVPAADRFECWNELMGRTHAPMNLSSEHAADYFARLRFVRLGDVSVWPATFQPLVFERTPRLIRRSDPEVYHLSLVLNGSAGVDYGNRASAVGRFDVHTTDSSRPYEIRTGREMLRSVGIEIPKALLPLPRNTAERAIGRRMSTREGVGALMAQFVTTLAADTTVYQPSEGPRLGTVLADLVAAMFAGTTETDDLITPESHRRTLVLRIKAFIRRHLHEPELTPHTIAAAHHVSVSYLHRLFRGEGTTVAAWVRARRLEGARQDLADPALANTPVHAVAARWGFPRAADFSRSFRAAYDLAPKEYRQRVLAAPAVDALHAGSALRANDSGR